MLWRSFFQKQSTCMFCLFFWTLFKHSVQQKPARTISRTSQTQMFRIMCCPAVLMFQHQTRLWAPLYSSHTRAWHNLGYHACSLGLESRAICLGTDLWIPALQWFWAALCQLEQLFAMPMVLSPSPGPWHTPRWPCGTGWCSQPSSARSGPAHTAGTSLSPLSADSHLCLPCQQFQRDRPLLSSHLEGKVWDRTEKPLPPDFRFPILQMLLCSQFSSVDTVCSVNKIFNSSILQSM